MKTTMKLFAALTIMLGFSLTGLAQTPVTADINSKATVVGALTVENAKNLEFGYLTMAGPKTIGIDNTVTGGISGGTVHEGAFKITKTQQASVGLSFTYLPGQLDLTGGTGVEKLEIAPYTAKWNNVLAAGPLGTVFIPADGVTIPATNTDLTVYVHVGATVTPIASTVVGLYEGSITLKAEYN